jgi:hypothetical protein
MLRRKALMALAASVVMLAAVQAQQKGSADTKLTPLDYYQIEQQVSRTCHGLDSAADNGYLFARAFTADGVFVDSTGKSYEGREKLAAFAKLDPEKKKSPTYVSYFVLNTEIDPSAAGASARSFVMITTTNVPLPSPKTIRGTVTDGGQFVDEFVKTSEGWRIKKRTFTRASVPGVPETSQTSRAAQ